jgi:hypothetical protein
MVSVSGFDRFAVVVGAPRCGTTTLSHFLKTHPAICAPFVKEPHFFAQNDLRGLSDAELRSKTEADYLDRFFAHCTPERRVGTDASVSYLYTPEQMEPILRLWPDSRFVVAVRDPLEMLPSLHRRLIYIGDETLARFEDAWAAVPARTAGRRIPRSCVDPRWLRYDEAGRYGSYVERLFAAVGRERCLVVVFDDLSTDPRGQYRRLMEFLSLKPLDDIELQPQRQGYDVRFGWLQRFLKRPPRPMREFLAGQHYRQREKSLDGDSGEGAAIEKVFSVRKRLLRWNRRPSEERPLPIAVQHDIRNHLRDEVAKLGQLIGRDLGHWLQPREGSNRLASP